MYIIGIELPVLSMCNEASYLRPVIILEKKPKLSTIAKPYLRKLICGKK